KGVFPGGCQQRKEQAAVLFDRLVEQRALTKPLQLGFQVRRRFSARNRFAQGLDFLRRDKIKKARLRNRCSSSRVANSQATLRYFQSIVVHRTVIFAHHTLPRDYKSGLTLS